MDFASEKAGRGTVGNESVLLFEDGNDVTDPFIVNDEEEEEAECDIIDRSRLDALIAFFEFPTGRRVIGSSETSRRYGVVPNTRASLSVDFIRR